MHIADEECSEIDLILPVVVDALPQESSLTRAVRDSAHSFTLSTQDTRTLPL